ncbi:MAG: DUF4144 family protein [Pseudoalteromonas prydzensis]|uniref:DUF4144 family protein n=1 Tax=Pseudoalteromonas prydzensis TaxID=182141 RepID=UPI003F977BFF
MSLSFPLIISDRNELEIIEDQQSLDDYLYGLTAEQRQQSIIFNQQGTYQDLTFTNVKPLSAAELARRVSHYLAKEGHCCLTKITSLTPAQAFYLVK